jgi:hypothetical protein
VQQRAAEGACPGGDTLQVYETNLENATLVGWTQESSAIHCNGCEAKLGCMRTSERDGQGQRSRDWCMARTGVPTGYWPHRIDGMTFSVCRPAMGQSFSLPQVALSPNPTLRAHRRRSQWSARGLTTTPQDQVDSSIVITAQSLPRSDPKQSLGVAACDCGNS